MYTASSLFHNPTANLDEFSIILTSVLCLAQRSLFPDLRKSKAVKKQDPEDTFDYIDKIQLVSQGVNEGVETGDDRENERLDR